MLALQLAIWQGRVADDGSVAIATYNVSNNVLLRINI